MNLEAISLKIPNRVYQVRLRDLGKRKWKLCVKIKKLEVRILQLEQKFNRRKDE